MVSIVLSCEQEIKQMQVDNASSKRIDVRSFHILLIIYSNFVGKDRYFLANVARNEM